LASKEDEGGSLKIISTGAVLVASLLLNLVLLFFVLRPGSEHSATTTSAQSAVSTEPAPATASDGSDYKAYREALVARGLSDSDVKGLLSARLENEARQQATQTARAYWQRSGTSAADTALRFSAELARAREVLVDLYGAEAERDTAFARFFRPLDPDFSFLTSAQQIKVQKFKLAQQKRALETAAAMSPWSQQPAFGTAQPEQIQRDAADFTAQIAQVLEEPALTEYLLRDSAIAEQLRRSRVDFTEPEFRKAFEILRRLDGPRPDVGQYAKSRAELRALLGDRKFAALSAGRDPTFAAIQRAAEKHSLTDDTLLSVYEIFNDQQDEMLRIMGTARDDPQRLAEALKDAQAGVKVRLSGLVGEEVANDILQSYAQQARVIGQQIAKR